MVLLHDLDGRSVGNLRVLSDLNPGGTEKFNPQIFGSGDSDARLLAILEHEELISWWCVHGRSRSSNDKSALDFYTCTQVDMYLDTSTG